MSKPSPQRALTFPEVPWLIPFFSIARHVAMISLRTEYSGSFIVLLIVSVIEKCLAESLPGKGIAESN